MGKGKLERFEENKHLDNVYQPTIDELKSGYLLKGNWKQKVFRNEGDIILELGCGKGEYSVGLGKQYPDKNFIGVDVKGARLWRGAKTAIEKKLTNVAFLRTHIGNLPDAFAPNEVSELWLPCPDPQMKRARKRLTGSFMLNRYQNFLVDGGLVHLKTDSNFMFQYTKALIEYNELPLLVLEEDIYSSEFIKPELEIKTFYERQFLSRGITSKYICFTLPHKTIEEPDVEIPRDSYRSFGR
ncbi:tRNA (guanine-N(7)-)-methyltransferase [Balneicella halophila]|uniref:tRNA (guanine(46)-N(7))-methyltransferase n=1 Tax=Balneicella halophila TaxID=1537566 RepID=A0A7L4USM6_BALHA|nr:tRNA (guanosine(46)-N7)-methyltransferase TrmB [Balneicella halophila]PVX52237.1 tRNA (guanine-N(7)-)-methyltransferase [Balneicella halophila]